MLFIQRTAQGPPRKYERVVISLHHFKYIYAFLFKKYTNKEHEAQNHGKLRNI